MTHNLLDHQNYVKKEKKNYVYDRNEKYDYIAWQETPIYTQLEQREITIIPLNSNTLIILYPNASHLKAIKKYDIVPSKLQRDRLPQLFLLTIYIYGGIIFALKLG